MNNKIGKLIEKYRKEKGLTQSELANKLGVSNTAVSKWEHGNNLPDITLLEPLSEILGIDKLLLFTSEKEVKEETNERVKQIKRKNKVNLIIISILFMFSIVFTNYISYKIYKHKLDTIEKTETQVYRFNSNDEEFIANGYLILDEEGSTIILEQLKYQTIHTNDKRKQITNEYDNIELLELYVYTNDELIYSSFCKQTKEKKLNINDFFQILINKNIKSTTIIEDKNLDNISFIIKIDTKKEHIKREIKIKVSSKI